ncbi:MAG: hypothetical protein ABEJ89_04830 [Haloarculaceae archaeon]
MAVSYIASMLVMGAFAVLVLLAMRRQRPWYQYRASSFRPGASPESSVAGRPLFLVATFLLVAAGLLLATNAYVTGGGLAGLLPGLGVAVIGAVATVYGFARLLGHPNAMAAFETATVGGAFVLVAILFQVVTT